MEGYHLIDQGVTLFNKNEVYQSQSDCTIL